MNRFQLLILTLILVPVACQLNKNKGSMMLMDSTYTNDKNVILVHAKDTIQLAETMKNFQDNPNISKTDIDAASKIQSTEVQYVKTGDTLRVAEPGARKK